MPPQLPLEQRMTKALIWLVDTEFRSYEARRLANRCIKEFRERNEAAKRLKEPSVYGMQGRGGGGPAKPEDQGDT